jgi:hypothetical protein
VSATKLSNHASISPDSISSVTGEENSVDKYIVHADPDKVIEELNLNGRLHGDSLLPTGDPDLRFVTASAAASFYKQLKSSEDETHVTHITIQGQNKVVTKIIGDVLKKEIEHPDPNLPKVICSVGVDLAVGEGAVRVVTSLTNLVYQSRGAITLATYLNVSRKLNPVFGEASAYYVAKVTTFLTDTRTGEIVRTITDKIDPGNMVCEVLLGGPRLPSDFATGLYKPQLMQSIASPPSDWDQVSVRYSALLDGVVKLHLTSEQQAKYREVKANSTSRAAFVTDVIKEQAKMKPVQEGQAAALQQETRGAADWAFKNQIQNMKGNDAKAAGPVQQAREHQKNNPSPCSPQATMPQTTSSGGQPPPETTVDSNGNVKMTTNVPQPAPVVSFPDEDQNPCH